MKRLLCLLLCLMMILPACAEETLDGWKMTLSDWTGVVEGETVTPEVQIILTAARSPRGLLGGLGVEYGGKTLLPAQILWSEEGVTLRLKDSAAYRLDRELVGPTEGPVNLLNLCAALDGERDFLPWKLTESALGVIDEWESTQIPLSAFAAALDAACGEGEDSPAGALAAMAAEWMRTPIFGLENLTDFALKLGDPKVTVRHDGVGYELSVEGVLGTLTLYPYDNGASVGTIGGADGPTSIIVGEDEDAGIGIIGGADGPTSIIVGEDEDNRSCFFSFEEEGDFPIHLTGYVTESFLAAGILSQGESPAYVGATLDSDGAFTLHAMEDEVDFTMEGTLIGGILEADCNLRTAAATLSFRAQGAPAAVEDRLAGMEPLEVSVGGFGSGGEQNWIKFGMASMGWRGDREDLLNDAQIQTLYEGFSDTE